MANFLLAGGIGALLNCALFSHLSSLSAENLLQEMFIQPLSALRPVVFGFFGGTLLLLVWNFLKARVVRFLLDYNGWFLHPKRPINKVSRFVYVRNYKWVRTTCTKEGSV